MDFLTWGDWNKISPQGNAATENDISFYYEKDINKIPYRTSILVFAKE
jgi:hypothetical protein